MRHRRPRKPRIVLWGGRTTDWIAGHETILPVNLPPRLGEHVTFSNEPQLVQAEGQTFWALLRHPS